jgi:hypothetical protein
MKAGGPSHMTSYGVSAPSIPVSVASKLVRILRVLRQRKTLFVEERQLGEKRGSKLSVGLVAGARLMDQSRHDL